MAERFNQWLLERCQSDEEEEWAIELVFIAYFGSVGVRSCWGPAWMLLSFTFFRCRTILRLSFKFFAFLENAPAMDEGELLFGSRVEQSFGLV
jgi:hypothetical protein